MTLSRRTAIVPKLVMSATAATVASIPIIACLGTDNAADKNYILLAIGGFGTFDNPGGLANTGGNGGNGAQGGFDVLLGGAPGDDDTGGAGGVGGATAGAIGAGAISAGGVGFIVLAAAAFGGEAGGNPR